MCKYNLTFNIDDQVVDVVRPKLGGDKAMEAWMIQMLKKAMTDYAYELRAQTTTVTDGEELLRKLKALPNTPEGFLQLDAQYWDQQRPVFILIKRCKFVNPKTNEK